MGQPWVLKYKPKTLKDYIYYSEDFKNKIENLIEKQFNGHLLLTGVQGTGKTTLSDLIVNEFISEENMIYDHLKINASDDNSVNFIRDTISSFAQGSPAGKFKIIQLEEADYLTQNAQAVLRVLMEQHVEHCKFILTANYADKIIRPLRSRCLYDFELKTAEVKELKKRISKILKAEGIDIPEQKEQGETIMEYITVYSPDIRKIIQNLELNYKDGKIIPMSAGVVEYSWKKKIIDKLEDSDFDGIRIDVLKDINSNELAEVYEFIWNNLNKVERFKENTKEWKIGMKTIATYLYRHSIVTDPYINISALFIELSML